MLHEWCRDAERERETCHLRLSGRNAMSEKRFNSSDEWLMFVVGWVKVKLSLLSQALSVSLFHDVLPALSWLSHYSSPQLP